MMMRNHATKLRGQVRSQVQLGNEGTGIVPQGMEQIRSSSEISKEKVIEIRQRVRARYATEFATASWWKKILLWLRMTSEFKRELETLATYHSPYVTKDR
jgi:hypothetical protein